MLVEVSIGEVIDKLSILDIKKSKISSPEKIASIDKEIEALSPARSHFNSFPNSFWYSLLVYVNTRIWELTDQVKSFDWRTDISRFSHLSNTIFDLNQQRFRLKNRFNKLCSSNLEEQKGYAKTTLAIRVDSLDIFYSKLSVINEFSLKYDEIIFVSEYRKEITSIYSLFSVVKESPDMRVVSISELNHEDNSEIYEFTPLYYLANGRMGDFILSLSVIAEHFWNTGRKGVVYLSDTIEKFNYSLERAYEDSKDIINMQPYIKSYHLHSNQSFDINLAEWRNSPYMYKDSWNVIYSNVYGVNWGSRKWLFIPEDKRFKNKILIHSTQFRINNVFNINEFRNIYINEDIAFISQFQEEYDAFIERTSCYSIPFLKVESMLELYIAISSCKYFIGNLSMPMASADAMFKNRLTLLPGHIGDIHQVNMGNVWPMCTFFLNVDNKVYNYYSQFEEDKFMESLFPKGYVGSCVEVGAYDGMYGSNTLSFEERGWKCICIEPLPDHFEKCKSIRKYAVNCCISDMNKEDVPFYIYELEGGNQSAISSLEPDMRLVHSHAHIIKTSGKEIRVKCRTLTSVLDEASFPCEIDFISIDTENTEIDVLKGFDFSKYKVKYLIIENNFNESICEDYLITQGFKKFRRHAVNDFYVNLNILDINTHPYNKSLIYPYYHGENQKGKCVDETLREYFPNALYNGVFLDIGAYEPVNISNSYHFEKNGWSVICFEANTELIPVLKNERKNVYNYAISNESKEYVEFNIVDGIWGGGSLTAGVSAIDLDPEYMKVFGNDIRKIRKIKVPQKSLNDCLPEILKNSTNIDIVSIDVEGGELNVLKGFDLNKYSVKVFVIENIFSNKDIGDYLLSYNYILDKRIDYNEYYIKKQ
jgi:FkbM family methyltransferase